MQAQFTAFQNVALVIYVLANVAVGLWFARGQKDVASYYLAERSAPWWAAAISIISSDVTAVSYLGTAAFMLTGDLQLLVGCVAIPISALFVSLVFVPYLADQKVFTAYEYLERRFSVPVRLLASGLFLLMRASHLAVALYVAGLVVSQVFGIPLAAGLFALGGLTAIYTMFGGMKAVLWTDVIQFFVMVGGLVAVLVGVASAFDWDLGTIWQAASHSSPVGLPWLGGAVDTVVHTQIFEFGFGLDRISFWSVMLWTFFVNVGSYGSDQVLVQRYLSAGSRREMVASLMGGSLISIPLNLLMFATGVFIVAYYTHFVSVAGHDWVATLEDPNQVMTHFIIHGLPGFMGAIVIAGLFAGTMSSLSAGLNSLSTATYIDFIRRFRSTPFEGARGVSAAKLVTCLWGVVIIVAAILLGGSETIFEILAKVMSPFAGPLLGMFLVGMLSRRANSFGVLCGTVAGALVTLYVTYFTRINWMWYFITGCSVGFVAGCVLSYLRAPPRVQPGSGV